MGITSKREAKDETQLSGSDFLGNTFMISLQITRPRPSSILTNDPAAQRALQAGVDRLLGRHSDSLTWDYKQAFKDAIFA